MKNFDVVIIGAGLAGLQCAGLLGRRGAKVLLVERKSDLAKGVHTTGIFVRKTFEDFEFPAASMGRPISRVTLYSPRLRALALESEKAEFRVGKMGLIYDAMLEAAVAAGVRFARATAYRGARRLADGESIVTLDKKGETYEVRAKVLVGADGARSRVAKDLGLDENTEWIVGYEEVYRSADAGAEPRLHCFLDGRLAPGYLAWMADDGEEIHIGVGGYAKDFEPRAALEAFKRKVAGLFDAGAARPLETRGGRIPVGGVLRKIAGPHGLLIGDAAGAVSPLTAGGLDPAMRLSGAAAQIIAERLQNGAPETLLRYSGAAFRARFVSRLWMRRIIRKMTGERLLEIGCALLRTRLGRKFARHVFFGRGSFPDVELGVEKEVGGLKLEV